MILEILRQSIIEIDQHTYLSHVKPMEPIGPSYQYYIINITTTTSNLKKYLNLNIGKLLRLWEKEGNIVVMV